MCQVLAEESVSPDGGAALPIRVLVEYKPEADFKGSSRGAATEPWPRDTLRLQVGADSNFYF